ncbi:MAG: hypothetical protein HF982_14765 [Desulfobacteraceae bacterium]|nr:hypothetical protein [Desulfobacteraceae bacterium]MBC2720819.1 hypothetical protein [Desulfobacteraceae bacterium]
MKNYIAVIVTIAFFICPSICLPSYLIELKNGSTFITNHYWKKGMQIKFYFRGGVVGISRNLIRKIEKTDLVYEEKTVSSQKKPETASVKTEPEVGAKIKTEGEAADTAKKKDDLFMKEFNSLEKKFKNIRVMTTPELYNFAKELTSFRDNVQKNRLSHVYVNQIYAIYSMGDEIESAIKRRN